MGWQTLTSRELQVNWAALGALTLDPYLLWADATRFRGFAGGTPGGDGGPVQMALELHRDSASDLATLRRLLELGDAALLPVGRRFCVAQLPLRMLRRLLEPAAQALVRRFELGLALDMGQGLPTPDRRRNAAATVPRIDGGHTVQAVIDDGCPCLHASFRALDGQGQWRTRIRYFWFQEERRQFGFGASEIDAVLNEHDGAQDERRGYQMLSRRLSELGAPGAAKTYLSQMIGPATHGAHVLDVAAGAPNPLAGRYGLGRAGDAAATAPIIFVQLPRATVADTSGSSMNACVLEALAYIEARVAPCTPVVVNLSYGALAGPHDGSSLLERAIDDFLEQHRNFKAVVLPAGNGYEAMTHAQVALDAGGPGCSLQLKVQPNDPTDTFVEVWYQDADGLQGVDVELCQPGASATSGAVAPGAAHECMANGAVVAAVIHARTPPGGGGGKRMALLAIAPTVRTGAGRGIAPHGVWTLRLRNRGSRPMTVDAWIERDDSSFNSGRSRSQAVWLSALPTGRAAAPPIVRNATLNSFGHGRHTTIVGGSALASRTMAAYSGAGPGRPGEFPGPDLVACCEEHPGLGLLAAGTRSGSLVRMGGTSVAAPVVARAIANLATAGDVPDPRRALQIDPELPALGPLRPTSADPRWHRGRGLLRP